MLLGYAGGGLSFKFRMRKIQQQTDVPRREYERHYLISPPVLPVNFICSVSFISVGPQRLSA